MDVPYSPELLPLFDSREQGRIGKVSSLSRSWQLGLWHTWWQRRPRFLAFSSNHVRMMSEPPQIRRTIPRVEFTARLLHRKSMLAKSQLSKEGVSLSLGVRRRVLGLFLRDKRGELP